MVQCKMGWLGYGSCKQPGERDTKSRGRLPGLESLRSLQDPRWWLELSVGTKRQPPTKRKQSPDVVAIQLALPDFTH